MTQESPDIFKIGVNIPAEFLERLMDTVTEAIEPVYPKYDRTFMYWPIKGTWRPQNGSDPYNGTIGRIEVADEMRVEFAVKEKDVGRAVEAIVRVHPYEEPAIDVIPMFGWKRFSSSD
ncbi:hypothetical protein AUP07_1035 [methanogenic archaeon mixed culture ISO4-G1]|nr:hypothetical protein AUP07_1035 [methanogenic archaeon mixed culture ISO4-G1]